MTTVIYTTIGILLWAGVLVYGISIGVKLVRQIRDRFDVKVGHAIDDFRYVFLQPMWMARWKLILLVVLMVGISWWTNTGQYSFRPKNEINSPTKPFINVPKETVIVPTITLPTLDEQIEKLEQKNKEENQAAIDDFLKLKED